MTRANRIFKRISIVLNLLFALGLAACSASPDAAPQTLNLWPATPPGDENVTLPPEADTTKADSNLIAGRRLIRLGNVSTPTLTVYPAPESSRNGAAVIICPGGGHHILAYDLEGTEVAEWLNSIGVTAVLLKYRVPARNKERRWLAAVQDAQRAVSITRQNAKTWGIDPDRIGILGFSAGGETAGLTALLNQRQYARVDDTDAMSHLPNFAVLIYSAGFVSRQEKSKLLPHVTVTKDSPPTFFAHTTDDPVPVENAIQLYLALKAAKVPTELHAYSHGGHGYGLRPTQDPVTRWPARCAEWLGRLNLLEPKAPGAP